MCCIRLAAVLALSGCLSSMVRAPNQMPADGVVECTDSMETPLEVAALGVASIGASGLYVATADSKHLFDSSTILWLPPVLGVVGLEALMSAAEGASHVQQCRAAKRRGAIVQAERQRKAAARAEAEAKWKQSAGAARSDDCATVRELDPQVRELDIEFHDVVFIRDVAIARCLAHS